MKKQIAQVKLIKKIPCPFCDRAVQLLKEKNIEAEILDYTHDLDQLMEWKNKTGWATVPIILINDTLIGGYTDLKELDESGDLDKRVFGE